MKPASFSQKLWRFSIDPRLEVSALIEPMHGLIRQEMADRPGVLLAIHDWSTLSFGGHPSKTGRVELTHAKDVGDDLASVLMVRGDDGAPIAPALVSLTTADGVLSTRADAPAADLSHIDQVRVAMRYVDDLKFNSPLVHVIDREADSVNHWRQWSVDGYLALVRADDRKVLSAGEETSLVAIADRLRQEDAFKDAGTAKYHGRRARLYVAETEVILHRPGKRNVGKKKIEIPGPPLPLRWLQRDGHRVLIKLMLALGACASIWALERRSDSEAEAFKKLLMQLSGRQTKRNRAITTSGLLAGLWVLQCAVSLLARHGPNELNAMLENHLPAFARNNGC